MGFITVYGHHAGDPRYVLILDYSAHVITSRDAVRSQQRAIAFLEPGAMSERERELAHTAWVARPARSPTVSEHAQGRLLRALVSRTA